MDKGWIKLYRQIQDNIIWNDSEPFDRRSAWIDLILMANTQNKDIMYRGQTIKIKRGQVYTSIRKLSSRWHWSRDKVNRFIKMLIFTHMVERDNRTHNATLLTIVKYGDFQNRQDTNKSTNKSTDKDTDKSTDKSLLKNIKNNKRIKEEAESLLEEAPASEEDDDENYVQDPSTMWCTDEEWDAGEVIS